MHPELWDDRIDQLPGSIDNLTRQTYAQLHAAAGLGAEAVEARVRSLVKLFIGPCGAVTRMHQASMICAFACACACACALCMRVHMRKHAPSKSARAT